jgi:hypothetical protein
MAWAIALSLARDSACRAVLGFLDEQLAPAARADFAFDDPTRVRWLEEHAAVAALGEFGHVSTAPPSKGGSGLMSIAREC